MWQVRDSQSDWRWVEVSEWDVRGNMMMADVDPEAVVADPDVHDAQVRRVNAWVAQMRAGQVVVVEDRSWRWVD